MIRALDTSVLAATARTALALVACAAVGVLSAPAAAQQSGRKPETKQTTSKPAQGSQAQNARGQKPAANAAKPSTSKPSTSKPSTSKPSAASNAKPAAGAKPAAESKPALVETFNDWGAYAARGAKAKTCYALATPKERAPAALKRDPAYVFVSQRPSENVRNEVSIIMGFDVKPDGKATVEVGDATFELVSKGANLWVKNAAEESQLVDAMRKGARMIVKAPSLRGNVTTDSYSLSGVSAALDRVEKECR